MVRAEPCYKHRRQFSLATSPTNVITYYGYRLYVKTSVIVFSEVFGYVNLNLQYYGTDAMVYDLKRLIKKNLLNKTLVMIRTKRFMNFMFKEYAPVKID